MSGRLYIRKGKRGRLCFLTEEGRQAIIAGNKKPRSDESNRRRSAVIAAASKRPDVRAKRSAAIKAKWQDPDYRKKNLRGRIPPVFRNEAYSERGLRGLLEDAER